MDTVWELDFYSRPILDEQQKKLWEVLVCDTHRAFEYSRFCSSTQVNSSWLRSTLEEALAEAPQAPERIRFFRQPMNNMIMRACEELKIPAQLSRRTFALYQWLQQRTQEVYPTHPGFQPLATNPVQYEPAPLKPLPDALMGQQWAFVTLEASAFREMDAWTIDFGETFTLPMLGESEKQIPGLVVFSDRAQPLAAWMSGLEPAFLKFEHSSPPRLVLETGAIDRWLFANLKDPQLQAEAQGFETAKQQAQQVHFLAVQSAPDAESFAGFWLLQELDI